MKGKEFMKQLFSNLPIKIICLAAAVVLFLFHRINTLTERFFSVPLTVTVFQGYAVASAYPKTVRITLRGVEESIYPILEEDIEASVNLEKHKSEGIFRDPVKVTRKGSAQNVEPLEIRVEPQEITFTLERLVEKSLKIVPDIRGVPAYGYELVQYSVSPPSLAIRGPRSRVQAVTGLTTEEIDLSGHTETVAIKVKVIASDPLVRVIGDSMTEFRGTITETVIIRNIESVEIVTVNLSANLTPKNPFPPGSMKVQGTQLAVEGFKPEQFRLLIDCSAIKRPGAAVLHPRPDPLSGVKVLEFEPKEMAVEFIASGGEVSRR